MNLTQVIRAFGAACFLLCGTLFAQITTVPVPGGDHRAVCVFASAAGTWTFTVSAKTGKIAYIQPQIYALSHPTKTATDPAGPSRLCLSESMAMERVQEQCFDDDGTTVGSQEANFKMQNPVAGSVGSVTISGSGWFCIRIYVAGKSTSATIVVSPPV